MNAFENLKYRQIKTFVDVFNEARSKNREIVRSKYDLASKNFDEARYFLKALGVLSEQKGTLSMSKHFQIAHDAQVSDDKLKELLRKKLLTTEGSLRDHAQSYLGNFQSAGRLYSYKPTTAARLRDSDIRNFFVEIDLVEYNSKSNSYNVNEKYLDLFEAHLEQKKLSPKRLELILRDKDAVGKAAELKILQYERKRLARHPELLAKIEHIALNDVMAGYDILSWETERQKDKPEPRYIEVKAVSKIDGQFYWSRNEVERARQLTTKYALYLLPVIDGKRFDTDNLQIIQNPIRQIFDNRKNWECEVETYLISKTRKN